MLRKIRTVTIGIVALLLFTVGVQNADVVSLEFLKWRVEVPLVALVLACASGGLLIGYLLGKMGSIGKKRQEGQNK